MSKKVLLYYPWVGYVRGQDSDHRIPYSLLNLMYPLMEAGYDVELFDGRLGERQALLDAVKKEPLFVGITSMTGVQLRDAVDTSNEIKNISNTPVVWGGWHASILPQDTIAHPWVDIISVGYGERTVVQIAKDLEKGAYQFVYKDENPPEFRNQGLDLVDLNRYAPYLGYLTSSGCYFDCTFCAIHKVHDRKVYDRPIDEVVNDLKFVFDNYGCFKQINLDDDNFFISKKRVMEFCDKWNNYANVPIAVLAHVRVLNTYSDDMWEKMVKAGIKIYLIGAESGSQVILDRLHKQQTPEQMLKFVEKTKQFGVQPDLSCLTGFPDSDAVGDFRDTCLFLQKAGKINPAMKFKIFWIRPYPGTVLFDDFVRKGIKMPGKISEWSDYTLRNKPEWVGNDLADAVNYFIYHWVPSVGWDWDWKDFEWNLNLARKQDRIPKGVLI